MKHAIVFFSLIVSFATSAESPDVRKNLETQLISLFQTQKIVFHKNVRPYFKLISNPIRHATMNVRILKGIAVRKPDGTFAFEEADVCSGTSQINVYDARKEGLALSKQDLQVLTCTSVFQNEPVTINVGGALALASRKLFKNDEEDFKGAFPFIWFETKGRNAPDSVTSFVGSADLDNKESMLTFLRPSNLVTCPKPDFCQPTVDEYFTATIEVLD